jgi:hypothetical protein
MKFFTISLIVLFLSGCAGMHGGADNKGFTDRDSAGAHGPRGTEIHPHLRNR